MRLPETGFRIFSRRGFLGLSGTTPTQDFRNSRQLSSVTLPIWRLKCRSPAWSLSWHPLQSVIKSVGVQSRKFRYRMWWHSMRLLQPQLKHTLPDSVNLACFRFFQCSLSMYSSHLALQSRYLSFMLTITFRWQESEQGKTPRDSGSFPVLAKPFRMEPAVTVFNESLRRTVYLSLTMGYSRNPLSNVRRIHCPGYFKSVVNPRRCSFQQWSAQSGCQCLRGSGKRNSRGAYEATTATNPGRM